MATAGVNVLFLQVPNDDNGGENGSSDQSAAEHAAGVAEPIPSDDRSNDIKVDSKVFVGQDELTIRTAAASRRLLDQLQLISNRVFDLHEPLSVPMSFLVDSNGRLAAIYRGQIDVDALLADVGNLGQSDEARRTTALPFPGRWSTSPRPSRLLLLALDMIENGMTSDAESLWSSHRDLLEQDREVDVFLFNLGQAWIRQGNQERAQSYFQQALRHNGQLAAAHYNLGVILAKKDRLDDAIKHFRKSFQVEPTTFAHRLAYARALHRAGQSDSATRVLMENTPSDQRAAANYELAILLMQRGRVEDAIRQYRRAIELDREFATPERFERFATATNRLCRLLREKSSAGARLAEEIQQMLANLHAEVQNVISNH